MNALVRHTSSATYGFRPSRWDSPATGPGTLAPAERVAEPLSQERLETLAVDDPDRLFQLIREERLDVPLLTYAAEAVGHVAAAYYPQASQLLRRLLTHPHPVVREGAVYGIAAIAGRIPSVLTFLEPLAGPEEPSAGVREAAAEVLAGRRS